jgi:hypothetical protein
MIHDIVIYDISEASKKPASSSTRASCVLVARFPASIIDLIYISLRRAQASRSKKKISCGILPEGTGIVIVYRVSPFRIDEENQQGQGPGPD